MPRVVSFRYYERVAGFLLLPLGSDNVSAHSSRG
jgi:hypothetical protein